MVEQLSQEKHSICRKALGYIPPVSHKRGKFTLLIKLKQNMLLYALCFWGSGRMTPRDQQRLPVKSLSLIWSKHVSLRQMLIFYDSSPTPLIFLRWHLPPTGKQFSSQQRCKGLPPICCPLSLHYPWLKCLSHFSLAINLFVTESTLWVSPSHDSQTLLQQFCSGPDCGPLPVHQDSDNSCSLVASLVKGSLTSNINSCICLFQSLALSLCLVTHYQM